MTSDQDNTEWLTVNQAAELAGVQPWFLTALLRRGKLPYYTTPTGARRVRRVDLDAWIVYQTLAKPAPRTYPTTEELIREELGLTPQQAEQIGLTDPNRP